MSQPNSTPLDQDKVYNDVLYELEDVSRLAISPKINRLFHETLLKTSRTFEESVLRALAPVRPGRQVPTRADRDYALSMDIEEIDSNFLDEYVEIAGLEALDKARQAIHAQVDLVINHVDYADAVKGYREQHQGSIWRNTLYNFLAKNGFTHLERITPETPLYHGLCVSEDAELDPTEKQDLLSPEAYVDKLKSILEHGVKSSPNSENLPCLESAFCVTNIGNAYGLLAVKFFIAPKQKVWTRNITDIGNRTFANMLSEGCQLVVPAIQKPVIKDDFEVVIRSRKFFQDHGPTATKDIFGQITRAEHKQYVSQLTRLLKSAGIPFQMIDPDGTTRAPKTRQVQAESVAA